MTDSEIIAELKREPAAELRRLQKQPYEWKVEHALEVKTNEREFEKT